MTGFQHTSSADQRPSALNQDISKHWRPEEPRRGLESDLAFPRGGTELILQSLRMASASLELDQVLKSIAQAMADAAGVSHCIVFLGTPDDGRLVVRAVAGPLAADHFQLIEERYRTSGTPAFAELARVYREPLFASDAQADQRVDTTLARALGVKSLLVVPIRLGDAVLGVAAAYEVDQECSFSAEQVALAQGIARATALAIENARLFGETQRHLAESRSLARAISAMLRTSAIDEVLSVVCGEACDLIGAGAGVVLLLGDDGWLRVAYSEGWPQPSYERLPLEGSLAETAVRRGAPLSVNDPRDQVTVYAGENPAVPLLTAPLRLDTRVIGLLELAAKTGGFGAEDERLVGLFAGHAAIAIERARLQIQAEQCAALEERQRLARDLHDSVTQSLYGITMYGHAAAAALRTGRQAEVESYLRDLQSTAQEAMRDMRLLLFGLHPPLVEEEGLVAAIQARLAAVEARCGLQTEIQVAGEIPPLPCHIEEELYWIIQEALTNVLKHARAEFVTVTLSHANQVLCIQVSDNGCGFDPPSAADRGGVGLRSVSERAARIHGILTIQSAPGTGTRLSVEVALADLPPIDAEAAEISARGRLN